MIRKQIHFFVNRRDAQLRSPYVDFKVWDAAARLLNRCRTGNIKQVVVSDRELSMKFDAPIVGRVF